MVSVIFQNNNLFFFIHGKNQNKMRINMYPFPVIERGPQIFVPMRVLKDLIYLAKYNFNLLFVFFCQLFNNFLNFWPYL